MCVVISATAEKLLTAGSQAEIRAPFPEPSRPPRQYYTPGVATENSRTNTKSHKAKPER